jgi:hypothetical protein
MATPQIIPQSKEPNVGEKNPNTEKPPYPNAASEILVEFSGTLKIQPNQETAIGLTVNTAMTNSDVKRRTFMGVRFSMASIQSVLWK